MPITLIPQSLLIYVLLCGVAGYLGRNRRAGFWGFFFLSLIVTPIITAVFIYVAKPAVRHKPAAPRRQ
jgi:hypothetical protein